MLNYSKKNLVAAFKKTFIKQISQIKLDDTETKILTE